MPGVRYTRWENLGRRFSEDLCTGSLTSSKHSDKRADNENHPFELDAKKAALDAVPLHLPLHLTHQSTSISKSLHFQKLSTRGRREVSRKTTNANEVNDGITLERLL